MGLGKGKECVRLFLILFLLFVLDVSNRDSYCIKVCLSVGVYCRVKGIVFFRDNVRIKIIGGGV